MSKGRHPDLKKLLDILGDFDKAGDIYSYLAQPENLKIIRKIDEVLYKSEEK